MIWPTEEEEAAARKARKDNIELCRILGELLPSHDFVSIEGAIGSMMREDVERDAEGDV
jgi:hypothetical protein